MIYDQELKQYNDPKKDELCNYTISQNTES